MHLLTKSTGFICLKDPGLSSSSSRRIQLHVLDALPAWRRFANRHLPIVGLQVRIACSIFVFGTTGLGSRFSARYESRLTRRNGDLLRLCFSDAS